QVVPRGIRSHLQSHSSEPISATNAYAPLARGAAEWPFLDPGLLPGRRRSHPEINGKIIRVEVAHGVAEADLAVDSVEVKLLAHDTGHESNRAAGRASDPAAGIQIIA